MALSAYKFGVLFNDGQSANNYQTPKIHERVENCLQMECYTALESITQHVNSQLINKVNDMCERVRLRLIYRKLINFSLIASVIISRIERKPKLMRSASLSVLYWLEVSRRSTRNREDV